MRDHRDPFQQFTEEWEKISAPLKLVLRIIRNARRRRDSALASQQEKSALLKKFLGWDGFSFVFFTGLAFAFLSLPHQYDKARLCFVVAAVALTLRAAHSVSERTYPRVLVALLGAVVAGVAANKVNDWVTALEIEAINNDVPTVRVVPMKIAPAPPLRSDIVFDGVPYFGQQKDGQGQPLADQNLKIGMLLGFNFGLKQTGPNPVEVIEVSRRLYIESDSENRTQRKAIQEFKTALLTDREPDAGPRESHTFTVGQTAFDTAVALADSYHHPRIVSQDDLDALHAGNEIAIVLAQITYKDIGKTHHSRLCY